ncbi:MAG: SurA N-terminal domain-containing protein [Muribaculaceae bacterium]|nr:SurA N-terminal domain-containing protein [Muribaculaceae bacterium]
MATLEKIRQRKKILAIVIGAALLAFIIEVGIEAIGRSGGNSAAAKIGSEKIDIMHFQKRVEQIAGEEQKNDNSQQTDPAVRQQQVLDEMINETLLNQEYEKIGITVSEREISELMLGQKAHPNVVQFVQQAGAKTPLEFYDFITNPGKQGVDESQVQQMRYEWNKLQDDITKQYEFLKLQSLMAGCMQANDLDLAMLDEEEAITNVVTFAKKDYTSLPDDKYPVSDAELKAEWEKMKPLFKLEEEMRSIHFIAVPIAPNAEDIAAAQKIADAAYLALQKGRGVDSVRLLGTVQIDTAKMQQKEIPASVRDLFTSAAVGTTHRDSTVNNHHVMYKLMNKELSLDSVDVGMVIIQGDKKLQNEVLAKLNGGAKLDEIKKDYPQKVDGQESNWQRVYLVADTMKAKLANAEIGQYFVLNSTDQVGQLCKVNERKAPKTFYTVGTVTYDAYASTKTSDDLRDKFQDFLNKNKTAKAFEENAAKAGYNAIETFVSASTPQLSAGQFGQGIRDTRKAIKWAFDNKEGQVSPIYNDNKDVMIAVAIDAVYDQDYLPYTFPQGKELLTNRVRNSKKGDALMAQYKGKASDLNGYAALMGVQIDTARVVFAGNGDPKLGYEPGIIGRIAAAKQGTLQGPWKGENAVFVYQVVNKEKAERKPSKEELTNRYAQTRGANIYANPQSIYRILSKATTVKKNLIKFY